MKILYFGADVQDRVARPGPTKWPVLQYNGIIGVWR